MKKHTKADEENWSSRIVYDCDKMARVIILLRDMAESRPDDKDLARLVDRLHQTYCRMANTLTIRVMLNGVARELGNVKESRHDSDK